MLKMVIVTAAQQPSVMEVLLISILKVHFSCYQFEKHNVIKGNLWMNLLTIIVFSLL